MSPDAFLWRQVVHQLCTASHAGLNFRASDAAEVGRLVREVRSRQLFVRSALEGGGQGTSNSGREVRVLVRLLQLTLRAGPLWLILDDVDASALRDWELTMTAAQFVERHGAVGLGAGAGSHPVCMTLSTRPMHASSEKPAFGSPVAPYFGLLALQGVELWSVAALPPEHVAKLIARELEVRLRHLPPSLVRTVYAMSGGSPRGARRTLHSLRDQGVVAVVESASRTDGHVKRRVRTTLSTEPILRLPAWAHTTTATSLDRVPAPGMVLLKLAAVLATGAGSHGLHFFFPLVLDMHPALTGMRQQQQQQQQPQQPQPQQQLQSVPSWSDKSIVQWDDAADLEARAASDATVAAVLEDQLEIARAQGFDIFKSLEELLTIGLLRVEQYRTVEQEEFKPKSAVDLLRGSSESSMSGEDEDPEAVAAHADALDDAAPAAASAAGAAALPGSLAGVLSSDENVDEDDEEDEDEEEEAGVVVMEGQDPVSEQIDEILRRADPAALQQQQQQRRVGSRRIHRASDGTPGGSRPRTSNAAANAAPRASSTAAAASTVGTSSSAARARDDPPDPLSNVGVTLAFASGFIRDAIYHRMLHAQRRRLHRAAMESLDKILVRSQMPLCLSCVDTSPTSPWRALGFAEHLVSPSTWCRAVVPSSPCA